MAELPAPTWSLELPRLKPWQPQPSQAVRAGAVGVFPSSVWDGLVMLSCQHELDGFPGLMFFPVYGLRASRLMDRKRRTKIWQVTSNELRWAYGDTSWARALATVCGMSTNVDAILLRLVVQSTCFC